MSCFSRFELIEYSPFAFPSFIPKTIDLSSYFPSFLVEDELDFPAFSDDYDVITDLIQVKKKTPFYTTSFRVQRRVDRVGLGTDLYLQTLSDRVAALELGVEKLAREKKAKNRERKYSWTAEIESPEADRKYKWTAEIKDGKKMGNLKKNIKYTAEIKSKDVDSPYTRTYTFKSASGDAVDVSKSPVKKEKKDKKKKDKCVSSTRLEEIQEDSFDHKALVLRQAFARRVAKLKGKRKEVSPQDAAIMIQLSFRAYLIRRSQTLRALRELAIAKCKLKEIRALFNNFSYRRQLSRDAAECQRFTEKIIVLLLTVDAIEAADIMVRAAKKSMVDELEAMLDVVDPQPPGKSLNRRTFDMPDADADIQKELAAGVVQVVRMLEEEQNSSETSEA